MRRIPCFYVLAFCILFIFGCRKYDDNPLIDIGSVQNRIEGVWDVQYIFVNGVDSTIPLKNDTCYRKLKFLSPNESLSNTNLVSSNQNYTRCDIYGHYAFVNNKNDLSISFDGCGFQTIGFFGFQNRISIEWKINKLTSDQLWLERTSGGINCWIHFTKN